MADVTMEQMIEAIAIQKANWSHPEAMQPPCPADEIEQLRHIIPERLGAPLNERYLDLLQITNGITEQGVAIFASCNSRSVASDVVGQELTTPGLLEENEGLRLDRPDLNRLILYGVSDLSVHAYDMVTHKYVLCQLPDQPDKVYDTFDQMMIATLWIALDPEFRPNPWKEAWPTW